MLKAFTAVANAIRTAVGGLLQIIGPTAGTTRTMTVPDADFTAARADAGQSFTGTQTFLSNPVLNAGTTNGVLFLNAGKTVTSESGLTFDGTFLTANRGITVNSSGTATSGFYDGVNISGYDALGWSGSASLAVGGYRGGQWTIVDIYAGGVVQATFGGKNFIMGTGAISTSATDGFLYVAGCAGAPTGTPTSYSGRVPIAVDTTNNKLYFYSGGAWRDAGP